MLKEELGFKARLNLALLGILSLVVSFVLAITLVVIYKAGIHAIRDKVTTLGLILSETIIPPLASRDIGYIDRTIKPFLTLDEIQRIDVISTSGEVLVSRTNKSIATAMHRSLSILPSILPSTIKISLPVFATTHQLGTIVIYVDLYTFHSALLFCSLVIVAIGLLAIALLYVLSQIAISRVIQPLRQLSYWSTRIAQGRKVKSGSIDYTADDELGVLVKNFKRMSKEIRKKNLALLKHQKNLKNMVAQRTAQLEQEISLRKTAEELLQRERQQLLTLITLAPISIIMLNNSDHIVAYSTQFVTDFELHGQNVLNKNIRSIIKNLPDSWNEAIQRAQQGETTSREEEEVILSEGKKAWIKWSAHPWHKPDGQHGGTIIAATRIDDLVMARQKAIKTMNMRMQFLATISHELRTPLTGILGFLDLLKDTDLTREQTDYISNMRESCNTLLALINDLLDLSKLESGRLALEKIEFNPKNVIDSLINTFAQSAAAKKLSLKVDIAPSVDRAVIGDPTRLRQIMTNLLGNAIKFTPSEGTITLTCLMEDLQDNFFRLKISVSDTGIGIPPEKLKEIFEPFRQVDASTTRQYGGTGLGLAICKSLVEQMGGKISVESEIGKGTTFSFDIILAKSTTKEVSADVNNHRPPSYEQVTADERDSEDLRLDGIKVLLAEDNIINQRLAHKILSSAGAELTIVDNGISAIEKAREGFDIILMDIQMPKMSGLVAAQKIREMETPTSSVPIIALSANAFKEDIELSLSAGMNDHLAKPFNKKELIKKIKHLAQKHRDNNC